MSGFVGDLSFLNDNPTTQTGTPSAAWLNDYNANIWVLTTGSDREEINWNVSLYDGSLITDPENSYILETLKRITFESRHHHLGGRVVSIKRVKALHRVSMCILDWVVAFGDIYQPKEYAFSLLDSDAIKSIIKIYVDNRASGLRLYESRFTDFFKSILSDEAEMEVARIGLSKAPEALVNKGHDVENSEFSSDEIRLVKGWLYSKNVYASARNYTYKSRTGREVFTVNGNKVFNLIGVESAMSLPNYLSLFFRQFESVEDYDHLYLVVFKSDLQYLPADYESIEDGCNTPSTMGYMQYLFSVFGLMKRLSSFVDGLPCDTTLGNINFSSIAKQFGAGGDKHTRTTPVNTALHMLGESIEFFLGHGSDIFKRVSQWKVSSKNIFDARDGSSTWTLLDCERQALKVTKPAPHLDNLNIVNVYSIYNSNCYDRNDYGGHLGSVRLKSEMTLEDSVLSLVSACFIIISTLSARRKSELMDLKRGCVKGREGAYELEFHLRKAVIDGERVILRRPIPNIAARAIFILEQLTRVLGDDSNESYIFQSLIDLKATGKKVSPNTIIDNVNRFCDYIDVPLTEDNRRWYPKSHEFRRFFAIVFFWQYKYSNLSAISWMLGHVDLEHTYAYIREVVGGREMTEEEARYASDAVLGDDESSPLKQLRSMITSHFKCADVSLVERDELELYLEMLVEGGVFSVRPHSFKTKEGVKFEMVFEIFEKVSNE
ncbi:hypothetical protein AB4140_08870 [Shewanella sp. 10N.286.51.B2]|uniref:hypothetical protein n=1 Tax=Shewanella sp. 10N.286.51.B2 TaxID=3229707 RepID=UPI00355090E8